MPCIIPCGTTIVEKHMRDPTMNDQHSANVDKPAGQRMLPTDRISYSAIAERAAPQAAGRRPHGGVGDRQRRGVGPAQTDAAHRHDAAGRRLADARHPQLGLARVRQPRRLLAHARGVRRVPIPGVLAINGCAIEAYEPIARAALERKWEFIGHGFTQKNMQKVPDERDDIRKTHRGHRAVTGGPPRGWLGPGLTETWDTPDILAEEGYEYVCDWVLDDQPVMAEDARQADRQRALYAGMQRRGDDADPASHGVGVLRPRHRPVRADLCRRGGLRARDGARGPSLHHGRAAPAEIFPQALEHIRTKPDVLFWTGEQILDWYLAAGPRAP